MQRFLPTLVAVCLMSPVFGQLDTCVDFEGFSAGTVFNQGQSFSENGVQMTVAPFTSGGQDYFGFASISASGPHLGQALTLANATVEMDFGGCVREILFYYANSGGSVNFAINGGFAEVKDLESLTQLGDVQVEVISNGNTGSIRLITSGTTIQTLVIGGQEFVIDHVCYLPCFNDDCYDFEGLGSASFSDGDSFTEDDRLVTFSDPASVGTASVSELNGAAHLGDELYFDGLLANFDVGCSDGASFAYGLGGNPDLMLVVNGQLLSTKDPALLDGQQVAGVTISVAHGQVFLAGPLHSLSVGGRDLFVDHLCIVPCAASCIDFEEETLGSRYGSGAVIVEDGIELTVHELKEAGQVIIEDSRRAGHLGHDAALFDAVLDIGILCASEVTLSFGQYEQSAVLGINGDLVEVESMDLLDGVTIGGVQVSVELRDTVGGQLGALHLEGTITSLRIGGTELVVDHICHTPCNDPACVQFEAFNPGRSFADGDSFREGFTPIAIQRIQPVAPGAPTVPGTATIGNDRIAGGYRNEVVLHNAQLQFDFVCVSRVELRYGRPSGGQSGVRIGVNGTVETWINFAQQNGLGLGGAMVEVIGDASQGRIIFTGDSIQSITIGGVDVAVDAICFTDCPPFGNCIELESLSAGTIYATAEGDFATIGDLVLLTVPLRTSPTDEIGNGTVTVSSDNATGTSGPSLVFSNAGFGFIGPSCMQSVSFRFGDFGNAVYVLINNEPVFASAISELDGMTLGGVEVEVRALPFTSGHIGEVYLTGEVTSLEIAGNDLHLSRFCYQTCPEDEPVIIGEPVIRSALPLNAAQRQIIIDLPISDPDTFILMQMSTSLGDSAVWTNQTPGISNPSGQPDIRRFTVNIPLSTSPAFFRFVLP